MTTASPRTGYQVRSGPPISTHLSASNATGPGTRATSATECPGHDHMHGAETSSSREESWSRGFATGSSRDESWSRGPATCYESWSRGVVDLRHAMSRGVVDPQHAMSRTVVVSWSLGHVTFVATQRKRRVFVGRWPVDAQYRDLESDGCSNLFVSGLHSCCSNASEDIAKTPSPQVQRKGLPDFSRVRHFRRSRGLRSGSRDECKRSHPSTAE